MRLAHLALIAGCLGPALAWPTGAGAEEPAATDSEFQIIVVRGGGVARVTGDSSGEIREEVLREDPRPARPPLRPARRERRDEPIVIVVNGAPAEYGGRYGLGDAFFPRDRFRNRRHARGGGRHVYPTPPSGRSFHHGRARGHRRH